jgi:uncharacterized repeat protein (TIGR04138 family)
MICDQCKQRKATVFLMECFCDMSKETQDAPRETRLCVECARQRPSLAAQLNAAELVGFEDHPERLAAFLDNVTRYPREAYEFICEALHICIEFSRHRPAQESGKQTGDHASGQELLEFIRELALQKFGKQAKAILGGWKVFRTEDFGEIVFDMVDARLLMKRPEDSKEDFQNGYSFDEAFPED